MRKRSALLIVVLLLGCTAVAKADPVQWVAGNGHWYNVVLQADVPWDTARAAAQSLGAGWDLATVTSAGEQAFIAGLLQPCAGAICEYWLGGFQPEGSAEPAGNWQWINSEGVFWDNGATAMYSDWGALEPNNGGGEPYLAMDNRYSWGWNDTGPGYYSVLEGYVAEFAGSPEIPEPASLLLVGSGLGAFGLIAFRRRRK